ncbi:putative lipid-binding transport protein (Tim44 family) [Herbaspirillum sp. Sphag1AN]|uniref:Tim44 domain-containing protein n=1 Tax=unclassified Herbaspirillum TaxID=2624150 RepID=UPI00160A10FD|nr:MULTISPECIES: Tim44-like domain-containing protein [unclassified Herbaspirillum]MBB3212828.1 putative lipid-binding transport protein (Tim44 family) [Herbaspirillum sp. Sphag1AN]MBB3246025.1 putative lipid-binding transport protein (Tim44 family) [Herbaspirillum sp. Sphag64]
MKKAFVALLVAALTLSAGIGSVEAKRLGGGGSFGKQSSSASRQAQSPMQQNQAAAAKPAAPAAGPAAAPKPSPWKGILGGALLGLGLGALLSHFGLGGAMASMISTLLMVALLAFAAMFIYRMFRRKSEGQASSARPAYAAANDVNATPAIGSALPSEFAPKALQENAFGNAPQATGAGPMTSVQSSYGIPADFDSISFVRNAKTYFIRLQAAWDKGDASDIRDFTTPEMYGEIRLQLQERGGESNFTDVISLDAEMLGVETVGNDYVASLKFFGFIKEDPKASPTQFNEIWNLSKPVSGSSGWVLAGIQQVACVAE